MNNETSAVIERIKALASRDEDFDGLLQQVHKLAALAPDSMGTICDVGTTVYRGTNHHISIPSRIEEIWYPPSECILEFGRANRPGSPMFYCCSDTNGAFHEIGTKLGQYAILATWVNITPMIFHDVGFSVQGFERSGASRPVPVRHADFEERLTPNAREIRAFLFLAFTDPTPASYRLTSGIAEMFLACEGIAGILYPSVAKDGNVDNMALLPAFVRSGLKLTDASVAYIDDVNADRIGGSVVARLKSAEGGDLLWEYTSSSQTVIPPYSGVHIPIVEGERKRITNGGRLQIDGRTYNVLSGYSIELEAREVIVRDLLGALVSPA
jgi:hypothetical protein